MLIQDLRQEENALENGHIVGNWLFPPLFSWQTEENILIFYNDQECIFLLPSFCGYILNSHKVQTYLSVGSSNPASKKEFHLCDLVPVLIIFMQDSYIICGALCKMKTQDCCSKNVKNFKTTRAEH